MVELTQTICRQQPTNCLSVFDHFVGLAFKELTQSYHGTATFCTPLKTSENQRLRKATFYAPLKTSENQMLWKETVAVTGGVL